MENYITRALYRYNENEIYNGQWIGNKRNGIGRLEWKGNIISYQYLDGTYYEGNWKDDSLDGNGKFVGHNFVIEG